MHGASGTVQYRYEYDRLGQLIREDNRPLNKTIVYIYDYAGNLTQAKTCIFTTAESRSGFYLVENYTYDGNRLTSDVGNYDALGNPWYYHGADLTWDGRRLTEFSDYDGNSFAEYYYNADGIRIGKLDNFVSVEYILDGTYILEEIRPTYRMYFDYDLNGSPFAFTYIPAGATEAQRYLYEKNLQGDIVGILDENGTRVVTYRYDAWGAVSYSVSSSAYSALAQRNPFRYRGYYYDNESGFYYLNTRYYDPATRRFISADDPEILLEDQDNLLQYNLFAYCFNNPVNMFDPTGESLANIIGGIIGGVAGAALGYLLADVLGLKGWKKWALISAATVGGAVLGAFLGPYVAKLAKSIGSAAKTAVKTLAKGELCFVAGTQILTENGHIPIEDIKAGDYVYAENPETGEKGLKRVEQTFINEINELIYVTVNGEEILTTPGHPFYVVSKGWIGADSLEIGDQLVVYGGEQAVVEKVKIELLNEPITVYNFEVEDFHTYYVGENSILVHNKGCGLNKLADSYIKKTLKLDAHAIKREYLGNKAKISLYDLAVDKKTGIIYIVDKAGRIVTDTIYKSK